MQLPPGEGPLYQRLADKLGNDIRTGVIGAGERLPTQRDLAADLGTTVGTVGRAYSLLRERGLVSGEVGRGTYVEIAALPGATIATGKAALFAKISELEAGIAELRELVEKL